MGRGIAFGAVVLVAGLLLTFGLLGKSSPLLIGLGMLLLAICGLVAAQYGFAGPARSDRD